MDVSIEPEMKKEVERVMTNVLGVEGVHALRIRRSGPFLFAEAHLEVDKMLTVERAHQIAEEVEDTVKKRFEKIDTISIHIGVAHRS
jgi:divalent metal cation (Fe/Co/Zn/Cd) transporter